jgi:hypothetical protein
MLAVERFVVIADIDEVVNKEMHGHIIDWRLVKTKRDRRVRDGARKLIE